MEEVRVGLLVAATLATGLFAGVFTFYQHTVMPALRKADDRTFVEAYTLLDHGIVNPVFLLSTFLGAPVLTAAATATSLGEDAMGWSLGALGLQLLTVVVTARFNLPRNDRLKAAALAPDRDDPTLRAEFDESGWARANLVRVIASLGSLGLLAGALLRA